MTRNVGSVDRIVRALVGIVLVALWVFGITQGTLAVILGIVGIVLVATSAISFCPLYGIFGIRTCPVEK